MREPWAWAVTWDGHELYGEDGEILDHYLCGSLEEAQRVADHECVRDEEDEQPKIVPLYPMEDGARRRQATTKGD